MIWDLFKSCVCVSALTQHDGLPGGLALLDELVLHPEARHGVRGRDPGDDEAAGGDFSHRLRGVDHGRRRRGLAVGRGHYRRRRKEGERVGFLMPQDPSGSEPLF